MLEVGTDVACLPQRCFGAILTGRKRPKTEFSAHFDMAKIDNKERTAP